MKPTLRVSLSVAMLSVSAVAVCMAALNPSFQKPTASGDVARGKYLVEEVAKCAECHTPRDAQGRLDPQRWLQGAPIWIMPVHPTDHWADRAPALAGFPGYSDADAVNILEKGVGPRGEVIRPPMHIYHLSHEDARAIVAYLRTVPAASQ